MCAKCYPVLRLNNNNWRMRLPGVARDRERRHFVPLIVPGVAPLSFDRTRLLRR